MQFKVGILAAVAAAILFAALIFPTRGVNPFSAKATLIAFFPEVAGLRASAPVWLTGIEIGSVGSVRLIRDGIPSRVKVTLRIQRRFLPFLRSDSQAVIKSMGLLGDMYIELTPGTRAGEPITEGAVLTGIPPGKPQEELNQAIATAKELMQSLNRMVADISSGEGTLGQLIRDPELYADLREAVRSLRGITSVLNSEKGTAGRLLRDPKLYDEMVATFKGMNQVVEGIRRAEAELVTPETQQTITETVQTASRLVRKINEYEKQLSQIHFYLDFGADKYFEDIAAGYADLTIWTTPDRYFVAGVHSASRLYGNETNETTYIGQTAWRILNSPIFIRGGLMRSDSFLVGLDYRTPGCFFTLLDAYRLDLNPIQMDIRANWRILDHIELSVGAEDFLRVPYYKAGVAVNYRDDDFLNLLLQLFR